jgi:hypothetical protein
MPDLFSQIMGNKPYTGMYPGSNPYDKAMMVKEKIPSAQQEALQEPTVDPIKATALAASGGAGAALNPMGVFTDATDAATTLDTSSLFSYLMNRMLMKGVNKVRNTPIDQMK